MGVFAIESALEALAQSGWREKDALGIFMGVGGLRVHWNDLMPALINQREDGEGAWDRGLKQIHPFWMLRHLSNNAHALLSAEIGAKGEGVTFGGANAGATALSAAIRALEEEAVEAALVVAYDSLLEPETLVELAERRVVTRASFENLASPYDEDAAGLVPGEAAAAVLLVHDSAPCARPFAWVSAVDGADGEPGNPRPETLSRLTSAVCGSDSIVDGAACSDLEFDLAERFALAHALRPDARLTATASAFGCLGAATALVQIIALSESLRRGLVPPVAGLKRASEGPLIAWPQATPTRARSAIGIGVGAPGLAGAIRVELS
jgi:3-oxoacyl-(acyl-carrier-protein) synthase